MPYNPSHFLYLDDSGTKEYSPDRRYSLDGGKTPYFVFGGTLLTQRQASIVDQKMCALKLRCFGSASVEIKANWLRFPPERTRRYLIPFRLTDAQLNSFVNEVYELLSCDLCLHLACIVNKAEVQETYHKSHHYPPSIAYDCVLQRAQQQMQTEDGIVHIIIDDMSGATPAGNQYRENLNRQHRLLRTKGSALRKGMPMDRIGNLSFSNSAADHRLQLADLVAYAVYRQFVDHGPDWEKEVEPLPCYSYFDRISSRFRNQNGRVQGFGVVKFPRGGSVRWQLEE